MTTENEKETEVELEVETVESEATETETAENTEEAKSEETKEDEVEVIIEEEEKEDPYQDRYMRLHAEFDNYRRRTAKEQLAMMERANGKLLGEFTEVVENFDRALSTEGQNIEDFTQGVKLIQDQFHTILTNNGLETIDPVGQEFDPNLHEALMQQPSEEIEEGKVITVFKKGYQLKGKVLSHAKVIVSSGSPA